MLIVHFGPTGLAFAFPRVMGEVNVQHCRGPHMLRLTCQPGVLPEATLEVANGTVRCAIRRG
jgi:hypothetical protein